MAKYIRTPEMEQNMVLDSFGGNVELDLPVQVVYVGNKLKVFAPKLNCYLQFPRALRKPAARFVVDCAEAQQDNGRTFYRVYRNSIRDMNGEVVG